MKRCLHCKEENIEQKKFCKNCGMRLGVAEGAPSDAQQKTLFQVKKEEIHRQDSEKNEKSVKISENDKEKVKQSKEVETKEITNNSKEEKTMSEKNTQEKPEKDPFAYDFKEDKKKANDNFWLFVIGAAVIIFIIVIGTSRKNANEKNEAENENSSSTEQLTSSDDIQNQNSAYSYEATSTLQDTTGIGFDYSAGKVADKDFSTAWIEASQGIGTDQEIKINFNAEKEISHFGIVPGYGRDEVIYKENNRLKKIEVIFSDGTTIERSLEDKYAMHFIEFDSKKTDSVAIRIKEVYRGSKYNDTAIAEIDFDSDYVKSKDVEAAMRYYEENKKDSALRPN